MDHPRISREIRRVRDRLRGEALTLDQRGTSLNRSRRIPSLYQIRIILHESSSNRIRIFRKFLQNKKERKKRK